jgi:signal transduction histidine kinase
MKEVNLSHLLRYVEFKFKELAKEKNLSLKLNLSHEDVVIKTDERILEHAINNIVDNAIKYTEFGRICISVNLKTGIRNNEIVEFKIEDTGIGIPESKRHLIFEPFRQSSEGITRLFEGTGLGLTISQRLLKLLNGKITFESELGKGSTFFINLPKVP